MSIPLTMARTKHTAVGSGWGTTTSATSAISATSVQNQHPDTLSVNGYVYNENEDRDPPPMEDMAGFGESYQPKKSSPCIIDFRKGDLPDNVPIRALRMRVRKRKVRGEEEEEVLLDEIDFEVCKESTQFEDEKEVKAFAVKMKEESKAEQDEEGVDDGEGCEWEEREERDADDDDEEEGKDETEMAALQKKRELKGADSVASLRRNDDGTTYLRLPPHTALEVDVAKALNTDMFMQTITNEWTVIVDFRVLRLPSEPKNFTDKSDDVDSAALSVLQTNQKQLLRKREYELESSSEEEDAADHPDQVSSVCDRWELAGSEGEVFIDGKGGLGRGSSFGLDDVKLRAGRWTRVAITCNSGQVVTYMNGKKASSFALSDSVSRKSASTSEFSSASPFSSTPAAPLASTVVQSCFRCGEKGHLTSNCPIIGMGSPSAYSGLPPIGGNAGGTFGNSAGNTGGAFGSSGGNTGGAFGSSGGNTGGTFGSSGGNTGGAFGSTIRIPTEGVQIVGGAPDKEGFFSFSQPVAQGIMKEAMSQVQVDLEGLRLFGSRNLEMTSEYPIHIRRISVDNHGYDGDAILQECFADLIHSGADLEREKEDIRLRKNLYLSEVYARPPPLLRHSIFLETLGNHSAKASTQFEGFHLYVATYIKLLKESDTFFEGNNQLAFVDRQALASAIRTWELSSKLFASFVRYVKHGEQSLSGHLNRILQSVETLQAGASVILPFMLGAGGVFLIIVTKSCQLSDKVTVSIVNVNEYALDFHARSIESPPDVHYRTVMVLQNIAIKKVLDQAMYITLLGHVGTNANASDAIKVYEVFLPWLLEKPLEASLVEAEKLPFEGDTNVDAVLPPYRKSRHHSHYGKLFSHATKYLMQLRGANLKKSIPVLMLAFRANLLKQAKQDLAIQGKLVSESEGRILLEGAKSVAYSAAKCSKRGLLSATQLLQLRALTGDVQQTVASMPIMNAQLDDAQPLLELDDQGKSMVGNKHIYFPFFDRLLREDSVDHLALPKLPFPIQVPVDFFRVSLRVENFDEALDVLRNADRVSMLLMMQRPRNLHSPLILSLLDEVFLKVLPVPLARSSPNRKRALGCIWTDASLRYGEQLDALILLNRLQEHYVCAAQYLHAYDCKLLMKRILTPHCMMAIADALFRIRANDMPSELCMLYGGHWDTSIVTDHRGPEAAPQPEKVVESPKAKFSTGFSMAPPVAPAPSATDVQLDVLQVDDTNTRLYPHDGFGLSVSYMAMQTQTMEAHSPEEAIVRGMLIDYFQGQTLPSEKKKPQVDPARMILTFELDKGENFMLDRNTLLLLGSLFRKLGWVNFSLNTFLCDMPLVHNFPEWKAFRDITTLAKMTLTESVGPRDMTLVTSLNFQQGNRGPTSLTIIHSQMTFRPLGESERYPSLAKAVSYVRQHPCVTEDDLLHITNLPHFGNVLTASESELLLSFLTAPYMRVPLVISFFATEDRIHALRSFPLRVLFNASVFEPGKFLSSTLEGFRPEMVPTEKPDLLATPLGYLFNELCCSPEGILASVLQLIQLSLTLDVGNCFSRNSSEIILFVIRFASRLDHYMTFTMNILRGEMGQYVLRGMTKPEELIPLLDKCRIQLRGMLWGPLAALLASWVRHLLLKCDPLSRESIASVDEWRDEKSQNSNPFGVGGVCVNDRTLEQHTQRLCTLYAHIILLYRTISAEDLTPVITSTILQAHFFLAKRYPWGTIDQGHFAAALQQYRQESNSIGKDKAVFRYPDVTASEEVEDYENHQNNGSTFFGGKGPRKTSSRRKGSKKKSSSGNTESTGMWLPDGLIFTEQVIFDVWQSTRRTIVAWLKSQNTGTVKAILDACIDVSTGRGLNAGKSTDPNEDVEETAARYRKEWACFKEESSRARFAEVQLENKGGVVPDGSASCPTTSDGAADHNVEVDLGLLVVTYKNTSMSALPQDCANDFDVQTIFENTGSSQSERDSSLQAVEVECCENRKWYRIVGRDCDVQWWCTADSRTDFSNPLAMDSMGRLYDPTELAKCERWIAPILEPIRRKYFESSNPQLALIMSDEPIPGNASIAYLIGYNPRAPRITVWKEVVVYRDLAMVQVFDVHSHGRRFHRTLVFCSDDRYGLRDLNPSPQGRRSHWLKSERFLAGNHTQVAGNPTQTIILRSRAHAGNFSGVTETYIPKRLLQGLIPSSLLETHLFWQDDKDNLRGYPRSLTPASRSQPGLREAIQRWEDVYLHVRLQKFAKVPGLKRPGVCAYVTRMTRANARRRWLGKKEAEEVERREKEELEEGASDPFKESYFDDDYRLLNLMGAPKGSRLYSLANVITRLESLSYVLAWTRADRGKSSRSEDGFQDSATIDLLELPRLNMTFTSRETEEKNPETGEVRRVTRLFSVDHADLYISNERSDLLSKMIRGIPHSLLLTNRHGELQLLVPAWKVCRPIIEAEPMTTDLVILRNATDAVSSLGWLGATRYFLYPIHVSLSFLFTPSLTSAFYLMHLRALNRNYVDAIRLSSAVATDAQLVDGEALIFRDILHTQTMDHSDHFAFLMQLLFNLENPLTRQSCGRDLLQNQIVCSYFKGLSRVSMACRMDRVEELRLLQDLQEIIVRLDWVEKAKMLLWDNRISCLKAILEGKWQGNAVTAKVSTPVREKTTAWWYLRVLEPFHESTYPQCTTQYYNSVVSMMETVSNSYNDASTLMQMVGSLLNAGGGFNNSGTAIYFVVLLEILRSRMKKVDKTMPGMRMARSTFKARSTMGMGQILVGCLREVRKYVSKSSSANALPTDSSMETWVAAVLLILVHNEHLCSSSSLPALSLSELYRAKNSLGGSSSFGQPNRSDRKSTDQFAKVKTFLQNMHEFIADKILSGEAKVPPGITALEEEDLTDVKQAIKIFRPEGGHRKPIFGGDSVTLKFGTKFGKTETKTEKPDSTVSKEPQKKRTQRTLEFSFGSATNTAAASSPANTAAASSLADNTAAASSPADGSASFIVSSTGGFGSSTPAASSGSTAASSGFGSSTSAAAGGFGSSTPAAAGGFGSSTPAATTGFGSSTPAATTGFGSSTPAAASGFGSSTPAAAGGFGSSAPAATSGFGSRTPAATSRFGSSTPVAPASSGFGSGSPTVVGGFGSSSTAAAGGFGSRTPAATSGFGSGSPAAAGGFGSGSSAAAGGFGSGSSSAASAFDSNTSSPAKATSGFSFGSNTSSPAKATGGFSFGSNTSSPAKAASGFGSSSPAASSSGEFRSEVGKAEWKGISAQPTNLDSALENLQISSVSWMFEAIDPLFPFCLHTPNVQAAAVKTKKGERRPLSSPVTRLSPSQQALVDGIGPEIQMALVELTSVPEKEQYQLVAGANDIKVIRDDPEKSAFAGKRLDKSNVRRILEATMPDEMKKTPRPFFGIHQEVPKEGLGLPAGFSAPRALFIFLKKQLKTILFDPTLAKALLAVHELRPSSRSAAPKNLYTFPILPEPRPAVQIVEEGDREWLLAVTTNYTRERGVLRLAPTCGAAAEKSKEAPVSREFLRKVAMYSLTAKEAQHLSTVPLLECANTQDLVVELSRQDAGLASQSAALPFRELVEAHPYYHMSGVARSMVARLQEDVGHYADQENGNKLIRLRGLDTAAICKSFADVIGWGKSDDVTVTAAQAQTVLAQVDAIRERLRELTERLRRVRHEDVGQVREAIAFMLESVNNVSVGVNPGDESEKLRYLLLRVSGQETEVWLEYLIASLLSSQGLEDLQRLNPYLQESEHSCLQDVVAATLLKSNRVGQINRVLNDVDALMKVLQSVSRAAQGKMEFASEEKRQAEAERVYAGLVQKGEALATQLVSKRHFMDGAVSEEEKQPGPLSDGATLSYDPRFLVFEFTWNLLLRKAQVEMVREIMRSVRGGQSIVKQMIMGAGKTTVVGPLLCLMLADGDSLVVQAVPPALLEFSRSVLRSTFSSIMRKRIFTLHFDRTYTPSLSIQRKLEDAAKRQAVITTTPTALKSMMLKYIETLCYANDDSSKQHGSAQLKKDAAMMRTIVETLRKAHLIMDEVDLILHPLRSELNFPIGERLDLDFNPLRWRMPIHLLDAVYYTERGRMSVAFRDSEDAASILEALRKVVEGGYEKRCLQRRPHLVLLDLQFYHQEMQPLLLEWLMLWIGQQHVTGIKQAHVRQYLQGRAEKDEALRKRVEERCSSKHKRLLNLGRDWLRSYLPHCLQKIDRVSFGLLSAVDIKRALEFDPRMPKTRQKLAVPFVGKDVPSRSSEFAHPDVIIGLSILAYRYEGLRWSDFVEIINQLRVSLSKELGPYSKRKSNLRYEKWVNEAGGSVRGKRTTPIDLTEVNDMMVEAETELDNEVVSLRLLEPSNMDQMQKLYGLLRLLPDTVHYYLNEFIFPQYTRHQVIKLSESGQALGGNMLFKKPRIGFSGTPSELMPVELGTCGYERASDGLVVAYMTDPGICSYEVVDSDWSAKSLLRNIACKQNPPYHALIDAGALITGLSNKEVAEALLADGGLDGFEGVVFLDEDDSKVILVRSTGRVMQLAECGVPLEKRFAFYDQIHTTGMDIKHMLSARAVLTLGKDMTWRDYAQAAFRMRGIGKGQTIHLMVIPEIERAVRRELTKSDGVERELAPAHPANAKETYLMLRNVAAWLVINSMRSERVQFHQLCIQNVCNTWRKECFGNLMDHGEMFFGAAVTTTSDGKEVVVDNRLHHKVNLALDVFNEKIDFGVKDFVPVPCPFSETVEAKVVENVSWVTKEEQQKIVWGVLELVKEDERLTQKAKELAAQKGIEMEDDEKDPMFDGEQVREEEREQEIEQEQEQEQEIEIEKFVDMAYRRDNEAPVKWPFDTLVMGRDHMVRSKVFYPLSRFRLHLRKPLRFPDDTLVSRNYFDPKWSGERRLKNCVVSMEWVPSTRKLRLLRGGEGDEVSAAVDAVSLLPTEVHKLEFLKAFRVLDREGRGKLRGESLKGALQVGLQIGDVDETELALVLKQFGEPMSPKQRVKEGGEDEEDEDEWSHLPPVGVPQNNYCKILRSGYGNRMEVEEGRYFVLLSLAEAETIRRILHARTNPHLETPKGDMSCALRVNCTPQFDFLDTSPLHLPTPLYQSVRAHQSFRFINSELYYSERHVQILLRVLEKDRRVPRSEFFSQITGCRRRSAKRWEETPLARVFVLENDMHLIRMHAQGASVRAGMRALALLPFDVFRHCDTSNCGAISPAELWGGLRWLGVDADAHDVLDIFDSYDADRDGGLNYREFTEVIREPGEIVNLDEEEEDGNEEAGVTENATTDALRQSGAELHGGSEGGALRGSLERSLDSSGHRLLASSGKAIAIQKHCVTPYGEDLLVTAQAERQAEVAVKAALEAEEEAREKRMFTLRTAIQRTLYEKKFGYNPRQIEVPMGVCLWYCFCGPRHPFDVLVAGTMKKHALASGTRVLIDIRGCDKFGEGNISHMNSEKRTTAPASTPTCDLKRKERASTDEILVTGFDRSSNLSGGGSSAGDIVICPCCEFPNPGPTTSCSMCLVEFVTPFPSREQKQKSDVSKKLAPKVTFTAKNDLSGTDYISKDVLQEVEAFRSRQRVDEWTIAIRCSYKAGHGQPQPFLSFAKYGESDPIIYITLGSGHFQTEGSSLWQEELFQYSAQLCSEVAINKERAKEWGVKLRPKTANMYNVQVNNTNIMSASNFGFASYVVVISKGKNDKGKECLCIYVDGKLNSLISEDMCPSLSERAGPYSMPMHLSLFSSVSTGEQWSLYDVAVWDKSFIARKRKIKECQAIYRSFVDDVTAHLQSTTIKRRPGWGSKPAAPVQKKPVPQMKFLDLAYEVPVAVTGITTKLKGEHPVQEEGEVDEEEAEALVQKQIAEEAASSGPSSSSSLASSSISSPPSS